MIRNLYAFPVLLIGFLIVSGCLVIFLLDCFSLIIIPWMPICFLRDRKGMNTDGKEGEEELGGVGRGKPVIRMYGMKIYCIEKSVFNKMKIRCTNKAISDSDNKS